ncbi:conserved hypothetical protein [Alphaproteobacteria bacterium]
MYYRFLHYFAVSSVLLLLLTIVYLVLKRTKKLHNFQRTKKSKSASTAYTKPKITSQKNDFLSRNEKVEKVKQNRVQEAKLQKQYTQREESQNEEEVETGVVTRYDPEGQQKNRVHSDMKIVGVVEPKGFWSKFVMSQKMGYILARMGFRDEGFWVNLIKAQQASQGKDKNRGR